MKIKTPFNLVNLLVENFFCDSLNHNFFELKVLLEFCTLATTTLTKNKMKKLQNSLLLVFTSVFLFTACGGGGGSEENRGGGSKEEFSDGSPSPLFPPEKGLPKADPDNDPEDDSENDSGGNPIDTPKETVPLIPLLPDLPKTPDTGVTEFSFLVFADIHAGFTSKEQKSTMEIYPSSYSDSGNDLDPATFDIFLKKINSSWEAKREKEEFVLLLGDTASHSNSRFDNLHKAKSKLKELKLPIFYNHGNNDSATDHYGPFHPIKNYKDIPAKAGWQNPYLSSGVNCGRTYSYPCIRSETPDGYYSAYLQHKLKLISLESIMFAENASEVYKGTNADNKQFEWFERQMLESKEVGDSVIIAMHIAPGQWENKFGRTDHPKKRFEDIIAKGIIAKTSGNVIGLFTGHSHDDNTTKYTVSGWDMPRLNVIGLSTSHGNAPGFRDITMVRKGDKWAIKDAITYVFRPDPDEVSIDPLLIFPAAEEPKTRNVILEPFYSFNSYYCPEKSKSTSATLTLIECLRKKEINYQKEQELEKGGNPNCFTYNGQCIPKKEVEIPPIN